MDTNRWSAFSDIEVYSLLERTEKVGRFEPQRASLLAIRKELQDEVCIIRRLVGTTDSQGRVIELKRQTKPKLELPEGTKVGSVLILDYPVSDNAEAGPWEGTVTAINDSIVSVYAEYDVGSIPPYEHLEIDLWSGMDITSTAPVSSIELKLKGELKPHSLFKRPNNQ